MSVTITDNFTPQTWAESYPKTWKGDASVKWKSEFQTWAESYPKTWAGVNYSTWKFGIHDYELLAEITLGVLDAYLSAARISATENFALMDDETSRSIKNALVTLRVVDKPPKKIMVKPLQITIVVEDDFLHKARIVRKMVETIHVAELTSKHYKGCYQEFVEAIDFLYNVFAGNKSETISLTELTSHMFVARRLFSEEVGLEEFFVKDLELNKAAVLSVRDTILQASNAILNNIFARHGEITSLEDFEKLVNQAPGFTQFIPFKVGEYDYERALVKIVVRSKADQTKPTINNLTMHVDIPDTDASGTVAIKSTELSEPKRVWFEDVSRHYYKHYYNPPEVNVLVIGGYAGEVLTPYITSITTTYFDVEIRNASGVRVAGTISWFAKGY